VYDDKCKETLFKPFDRAFYPTRSRSQSISSRIFRAKIAFHGQNGAFFAQTRPGEPKKVAQTVRFRVLPLLDGVAQAFQPVEQARCLFYLSPGSVYARSRS
jgi:hypothetical protein